MPSFYLPIDENQLLKCGQFLYATIKNTKHIPYRKVSIKGHRAIPSNCHDNARFFVDDYSFHEYQDRWLCMIGDGSPLIMFAAPTIFIDSMGNSFDVTPVYFSEPRPSLPANIGEDSFAELIEFFFTTRYSSVFNLNI